MHELASCFCPYQLYPYDTLCTYGVKQLKRRAFFIPQRPPAVFRCVWNALVNPRNCPHCEQMCLPRCAHDTLAFSCFAACGFSLCRNPPAAVLFLRLPCPQCSRTSAQRPVFGLPADTRSAGRRKRHKPPTRARQTVTGVLSALSTCVFNKIGIFSPCRVLGKLLHLPVVVLLERELNWLDCE